MSFLKENCRYSQPAVEFLANLIPQMMISLTDVRIDLASSDYRSGVVGKETVADLLMEKRELLQKMKTIN